MFKQYLILILPIIISYYLYYHSKKTIIIIGGGITGVVSSTYFAEKLNVNVIVLEKKKNILQGSSRLCYKSHGGYEFSKDPVSALDCLKGQIDWINYFGEDSLWGDTEWQISRTSHENEELTIKRFQNTSEYLDQYCDNTKDCHKSSPIITINQSKDIILSYKNNSREKNFNWKIIKQKLMDKIKKYKINIITSCLVNDIDIERKQVITNCGTFDADLIISATGGYHIPIKNKKLIPNRIYKCMVAYNMKQGFNTSCHNQFRMISGSGGMVQLTNKKKTNVILFSPKYAYINKNNESIESINRTVILNNIFNDMKNKFTCIKKDENNIFLKKLECNWQIIPQNYINYKRLLMKPKMITKNVYFFPLAKCIHIMTGVKILYKMILDNI